MKLLLLIGLTVLTSRCSLEDARLFPTDDNDPTLADVVPGNESFVLLSGGNSSCYLYESGRAKCWGEGDFSKLNRYRIASMTLGPGFVCGIDNLLSPFCEKTGESTIALSSLIAAKSVQSISSGDQHGCVLTREQEVYCFGSNESGEGSVPSNLSGKTYTAIFSGSNHNCGIASDSLTYCWGLDDQGQVTIPSNLRAKQFSSLSLGKSHSCGLTVDKDLYCWGSINIAFSSTPYLSFTSGDSFLCAVERDRDIQCWFVGDELFDPSPEGSLKTNYLKVAGGSEHLCSTTSTNKTKCWGNNDFGQLDAGTLP